MIASLTSGALPVWVLTASGLIAGLMLGAFHFSSLQRVCSYYAQGQAVRALILQILRLLLAASLLYGLAQLGTGPLLSGALGFLISRLLMVRRERKAG